MVRGDAVEVRLTDPNDTQTALSKLRELAQPVGGVFGAAAARSVEVTDAGGG